MLTRGLSGAVYAALLLGLGWRGGLAWAGLVTALAVIGAREAVAMARRAGLDPADDVALAGAAALPLAAFLGRDFTIGMRASSGGLALLAATALAIAGVAGLEGLTRRPTRRARPDALATLALPLAVGLPLAHLVLLRDVGFGERRLSGLAWLLALLGLIWVSDTAAYLAGRMFGRRKLAPSISPGKTWEGFLAGLAATTLLGAALPALLSRLGGAGLAGLGPADLGVVGGALFGLAIGLAAPAGDLLESAAKRRVGVKDSGTLIPGHGGVLDRVDSLLLAAPLSFYVALSVLARHAPTPAP